LAGIGLFLKAIGWGLKEGGIWILKEGLGKGLQKTHIWAKGVGPGELWTRTFTNRMARVGLAEG